MKINNYQDFLLEKNSIEYQILLESRLDNLGIKGKMKSLLLSVGLLAGVLSGTTTANAQTIQNKIDTIKGEMTELVENPTELNGFIDQLVKDGKLEKHVARRAKQNPVKFLKELSDKDTYKGLIKGEMGKYHKENIYDLEEKEYQVKPGASFETQLQIDLANNWAISKIELDTVEKYIEQEFGVDSQEILTDTINLNFSSDKFFKTSDYKLDLKLAADIENLFQSLNDQELTILKIEIESSTDKQRVERGGKLARDLKSMGLSADNVGLSEARNNSFYDLIKLVFDKNNQKLPDIDQIIKYNQGKGENNATTPQDSSARYVNVKLYVSKVSDVFKEEVKTPINDKISAVGAKLYLYKITKTPKKTGTPGKPPSPPKLPPIKPPIIGNPGYGCPFSNN